MVSLVWGLAVAVAFVLGALQGWNRGLFARSRMERTARLPPTGPHPVRLGSPLWCVHLAALLWLAVGLWFLSRGEAEGAALSLSAALSTSAASFLYVFGFIDTNG